MSGKGDKRRPMQISEKEFSDNWNRIFNKPKDDDKSELIRDAFLWVAPRKKSKSGDK